MDRVGLEAGVTVDSICCYCLYEESCVADGKVAVEAVTVDCPRFQAHPLVHMAEIAVRTLSRMVREGRLTAAKVVRAGDHSCVFTSPPDHEVSAEAIREIEEELSRED